MRILSPLALGALLTSTAFGQTLVKDINPLTTNAASTPTATAFSAGWYYFAATDGVAGSELWRSNGTSGATTLVKDIYPGLTGSTISGITPYLAGVVFAATDGVAGSELWYSDGTAAGTVLVKDIYSGSTSSSPANFYVAQGKVWFSANDGVNGAELWVSDGTNAGTTLVKDINAGLTASSPAHFTEYNSKIYFSAADATYGRELWVTDGTNAGTTLVYDFYTGTTGGLTTTATYKPIYVLGSKLLVTANNATYGTEWWVTDGTVAGTSVIDAYAGLTSGVNQGTGYNCNTGTKIFWYGSTPANGSELWYTDGTVAGTGFIDIYPGASGSAPFPIYAWNGKCYAQASDGLTGYECWVSDGTPAGTFLLKDIYPGTSGGFPTAFLGTLTRLYFISGDGVTGTELYVTDGTTVGTSQVKDIFPGSSSAVIGAMATNAVTIAFAANDGQVGSELWKSDGTAAGTVLVKDINTTGATSASSAPANFTLFNGKCYFTANDGLNGIELWVSDGTAAGTVMVKDINAGASSASPANLTVALGKLWFSAADATNGAELWVSDGTSAGTVLVKDIYAGTTGSSPAHLTAYNGKVYFSAADATYGRELWVTDGTAAGTTLVYDFYTGTTSGLTTTATYTALNVLNGKLLVAANSATYGNEWWSTDGTVAGTALILDLNAGTAGGIASVSGTNYTCIAGNKLFWYATTAATGSEVGYTDGTAAGTGIVDIYPGTSGSAPFPLYGFNGNCYAQASNGTSGYEPWVTDGTVAGTILLKDIYVGTNGSFPARFATAGDRLFFYASDGLTYGGELWVTDGTQAGTTLVKDIYSGTSTGFTGSFTHPVGAGRRVLFVATDGVTGSEFYISDGTGAGTAQLGDLWTGSSAGASTASGFVLANGYGFVVGNNGSTGNELYAFTVNQLAPSEVETFGTNCKAYGNPTIGTSGGAPYVGNAGFTVTLSQASGSVPCALFLNSSRGDTPIGSCTIYPSLVPTINLSSATDAIGNASLNLPIPAAPWNIGVQLYFQWVAIDIGGPIFGVAQSSNGLRIRLGGS